MSTPLLEVRDLCMDFPAGGIWGGSIRVLDHVNFGVAPGEIRGLVGESGCGKTTLVRCSLRLIEPSSGSVHFDGVDLAGLSGAELRRKRREFQMIFQDPYASLNPGMSVEDLILEPLRIHAIGTREEQRGQLRSLMDAVSLDESLAGKKPPELSGGQQQRVGIARGLALRPRLLVADEPVSALDVSVQAQILNLLSDLQRRYRLTLILISHSLFVIHYLCTHVSVMYRGRVIEEAPSAAFFESPKHPYSKVLLDSTLIPDPVERRNGNASERRSAFSSAIPSGCAFLPNCSCSSDICRKQVPPLHAISPDKRVACFLYF